MAKKRTTKKNVQAHEKVPYIPTVDVKPEIDDDAPEPDGLTIRQRAFVDALVGPAGGNAVKAARLAGYRSDNYRSLKATAAENLSKPILQEAIAHALAKKRATPEWARNQLIDMARADMANFVTVDADGNTKLDFVKAASSGAIGQIKEYNEEVIQVGGSDIKTIKRKIKVHDRAAALALLLKLHGLLKEPDEQPDREIRTRLVKRLPDVNAGDP